VPQNPNHISPAANSGKVVAEKPLERNNRSRGAQEYPSDSELVARFFDTIGDVLPYVEEQTIAAKLHVLSDDTSSSDATAQSWRALLNIIIAYALYTLDGPSPGPYYRQVTSIIYGTGVHLSTLQTRKLTNLHVTRLSC
jgi:hypothetical protein